MRILLLSPPYLPEYMRNGRCDYLSWSYTQWLPIWLSYCGSLLEKHGHEVKLIDAPSERLNHKDTFKRIIDFSPNILVVYSSTRSQQNDVYFSEKIKDAIKSYVVFVGPYVSADTEAIFKSSHKVDAVVKGEFDYPILDLANEIKKDNINNLIWRNNDEIISNKERPLLCREELDKIPFVSEFYKSHLNLKNYKVPSEFYPFVDLFTGRGCFWGKCTFCLWPYAFIKGSVYNTRSIGNVIDELKFIEKEMPYVKEVFFQDDTLPRERAIEISSAILKNRLRLVWGCYVRGDIDRETLKLMKEAGCRSLHVGYESKSNLILKNICKGLSSEEMTEFSYNAHKVGLRIHGDFLLGLPGETENTIKETIRWAKLLDPETAQFLLVNLYPETPLYKKEQAIGHTFLSIKKMRKWTKKAYREFYIRPKFFKKIISEPNEYLFSQGRALWRMLFNIF